MRMKIVCLLMLLLLVGCQSEPAAVEEATAEPDAAEVADNDNQPTATPVPLVDDAITPELEAEAEGEEEEQTEEAEGLVEVEVVDLPATAEEVSLQGANDLAIQGTFTFAGGPPAPGVILLHMLNGNQSAWNELVPVLSENGYAVLATDMRGHGQTGGDQDWELAEEDLRLVWEQFSGRPEVDGSRTAVIGGSIGANMALITVRNVSDIQTAILLSPGLDYLGVETSGAAERIGERPLLIVASEEDGYAADSSRELAALAPNAELVMYNGAGHGTNMLRGEPELELLILDWLGETILP